jgi:gluconolactonase
VATLFNGGITVISPDGAKIEHLPMPGSLHDQPVLWRSGAAHRFVTLSLSGRLVALDWPRAGLALNFLNR